jgi:hypothetical protein
MNPQLVLLLADRSCIKKYAWRQYIRINYAGPILWEVAEILHFLYNFIILHIYDQVIKSYLHSKTDNPFNDTRTIFALRIIINCLVERFVDKQLAIQYYSDSPSWNTDQEVTILYEFRCFSSGIAGKC